MWVNLVWYLCIFKLLFNIFDNRLTIKTDERPTNKFWMNRVCSHNLTSNTQ